MATEHLEREDKYDVGPGFVLPDLQDLVPAGGRIERLDLRLESVYFDTEEHDLLRHAVTLRRRSGGDGDTGWQLKVPAGIARTELRLPPTSGRGVPKELREVTTGIHRGRPLRRVGTLRTERSATRVLRADGHLAVEVVDDRVHATAAASRGPATDWREVEVELGTAGREALLTRVGRLLRAAGARPSPSGSKIARALSLPEPAADRQGGAGTGALKDLDTQHSALLLADLALRRGSDDVQPGEVALRRLRGVLASLAESGDVERLRALIRELDWYAASLASARDPRVPPGRSALLRDMGSPRYLRLLAELATVVEDPPVTAGRAVGT